MPKIDINFECVESGSPQRLIVADFSTWAHIRTKPAIMNITMPGSIKPSAHTWAKDTVNGYNSVTLGLNCVVECDNEYQDIPDGIYFLELIPSPSSLAFSRHYLKTDILRLEIDKILLKVGIEYDPKDKQFRDEMAVIELLLKAAKAAVRHGEIKKGKRHYDEVLSLVAKYNCKDCI